MADPDFSINGEAIGAVAAVASGGAVVGTISNTSGVEVTAWSVANTDDSALPATFEPVVVSGASNHIGTVTAGGPGTGGELKVRINDGKNLATAELDLSSTEYSVKWYVPISGSAGQVLVAGEQERESRLSDDRLGMLKPLNDFMRQLAAVSGSTIRGGGSGRHETNLDTFTTVGGIVVDMTGTPSSGRVVEFEVMLSSSNVAITAEIRLFNLTTSLVVADSTLVTTVGNTDVQHLTATLTAGSASLPDDAEQELLIQIRKTTIGAATDWAIKDMATFKLRYA